MPDEKEILKRLVVEEKDILKDLERLVEKASNYFRVESPTGKINFQNFGSLSDKQRITVLLLGKYVAHKLELISSASLSISQIATELIRPKTTLSGPIKELVTKGYVEYIPSEKKYQIAYHRIPEIFDCVLATKQRK